MLAPPGRVHPDRLVKLAVEKSLPWAVLAILLFYSYLHLFLYPYIGFHYQANARIQPVYIRTPVLLKDGDRIIRAGNINWDQYRSNRRLSLFPDERIGQIVPIRFERSGQILETNWVMPEASGGEILYRVMNWGLLGYVFWLFGTIALILIKPQDAYWRLIVCFNYINAIWLSAGAVAYTHMGQSAIVLRMAMWLCVPIYLHLHWIFPRPLKKLPAWLVCGLYLLFSCLAAAEWFWQLPAFTFILAAALAVSGSVILLITHAILMPDQRRDLSLLAISFLAVFLPPVAFGIAGIYNRFEYSAFLVFPVIPASYFYTIYRRQMGALELRLHRGFVLFLFAICLFLAALLAMVAANSWIQDPNAHLLFGALLAFIIGLLTAISYPRFQYWVEHHLLGMPFPPKQLLEIYTARITRSLSTRRLVHLIRDEVLPTLLIRQAALLRLSPSQSGAPLFTLGISESLLPIPDEIAGLFLRAGRVSPPNLDRAANPRLDWIRLSLVLSVDGQPVGICLLGRRDPDDMYSQIEIPILQALMDQTAIALKNIEQAEQLSALYQADITRREIEAVRLARDLHDGVLAQLAILSMSSQSNRENPDFTRAYQATVTHIRNIINGLRPGMLNYGLFPAMQELVDDLSAKDTNPPAIHLEVSDAQERYPQEVELHLYRILQQACLNSLMHARAKNIWLRGQMQAGRIELWVEDDGAGFAAGESLDFANLLAKRHYGLASMHERAALIGASVQISSAPQRGTRVYVLWK